MFKINIIADNNNKSKKIKAIVLNELKQNLLSKNKIVIVIGGDGFMLKTLKKNLSNQKYFYGINSGNYGFLMNKFSRDKIIRNLNKAKPIVISPLEMKVIQNNGLIKKSLAINEVSILRQSRQAASLTIKYGRKNIIKNLMSDGVLVSIPATFLSCSISCVRAGSYIVLYK